MRHIRKNSIYDVYCISRYLYQYYSNNLLGVVSLAQLVNLTDSAVLDSGVLGGVVEFRDGKNFSAFTGIVDL